MAIDLITGHQGVAHISAEQIANINNALMDDYGVDKVVRLDNGTLTQDGLTINVGTGFWRVNGFDMEVQEAETIYIDPTAAGLSRIDNIYVEILQDIPTGAQRSEIVTVNGEPSATPTAPEAPTAPELNTDILLQVVPLASVTVTEGAMVMTDLTIAYEMVTPSELSEVQAEISDIVAYENTTKSYAPIITVDDALGVNAVDVKAKIEPVQSGSGTPSPTNIRPITGWDEVKVTRAQISATLESGGIADSTGEPNTLQSRIRTDFINIPEKATYLQGINLAVGYEADIAARGYYFYDANKSFVSYIPVTISVALPNNDVATIPSNAKYFRIVLQRLDASLKVSPVGKRVVINLNTYTISLNGTRYGGTLDVTSGELTLTHGYVDLGDLEWSEGPTSSVFAPYFYAMFSGIKSHGTPQNYAIDAISDRYPVTKRAEGYFVDKTLCGDGDSTTITQIQVKDDSYTDAATFKTAMSGVQLVYELATPQTINLIPTDIQLLQNQNTLFADSGDIYLEYRPNGIGNIGETLGELQNEDAALMENVKKNGCVNLLPVDRISSTVQQGVTFTISDDGTISTSGTSLIDFTLTVNYAKAIPVGRYRLTGCPKGGDSNTFNLEAITVPTNSESWTAAYKDYGDGVSDIVINNSNATRIFVIIRLKANQNMNGKVFKPMISLASLDLSYNDYVPYAKTNKELTDTFTNQIADSDDAYSPYKAYKVGEHCIYNDVLYKCITACSAAAWSVNQNCFESTTLTRAVTDLNNDLGNKLEGVWDVIANNDFFGATTWSGNKQLFSGSKFSDYRFIGCGYAASDNTHPNGPLTWMPIDWFKQTSTTYACVVSHGVGGVNIYYAYVDDTHYKCYQNSDDTSRRILIVGVK